MSDPAPVAPPPKGMHLNLAQPLGQLNATVKTLGPRQLREELAAQGLDTRGERYVLGARLRQWIRAVKTNHPRTTCGQPRNRARGAALTAKKMGLRVCFLQRFPVYLRH